MFCKLSAKKRRWFSLKGQSHFGKLLPAVGLFFFLSGCFYFISDLQKAGRALKEGACEKAWTLFSLATESPPKKLLFAQKAGEKCFTRAPAVSALFYDYLFKRALEKSQKILYAEKQADICFEITQKYEQALALYSFLKKQAGLSRKKKQFYAFRMALSYFELGKWNRSLKEVESLLKSAHPLFPVTPNREEKLFLQARIFLMQRDYERAEQVLQEIQKTYPAFFKEHGLIFYLSFIYEARKEFNQAVQELEAFGNTSEFLAHKIKRLKIRQSNQPGGG